MRSLRIFGRTLNPLEKNEIRRTKRYVFEREAAVFLGPDSNKHMRSEHGM